MLGHLPGRRRGTAGGDNALRGHGLGFGHWLGLGDGRCGFNCLDRRGLGLRHECLSFRWLDGPGRLNWLDDGRRFGSSDGTVGERLVLSRLVMSRLGLSRLGLCRLGLGCLYLGCLGLYWLLLDGLLGLDLTPQPLAVGLAPDTIRLSLHHARGMALHPDAQGDAEVKHLRVGHPHFSRQLIDADVLRHGGYDVLSAARILLVEFCSFMGRSPVRRGSSAVRH